MGFSMRAIFLTAMLLALPVCAMAAPVAPDKPVARIDSLTATLRKGRVVIQAKGAVMGGGWSHVSLKVVKTGSDPHTLVVEFVGLPPPANEAVIPGLVPVAASLTVPNRRGIVAVRAVSDANEITTQILK